MENENTKDLETLILEEIEKNRDPNMSFDKFMKGVVEEQERKSKLIVEKLDDESYYKKARRMRYENPSNKIRYR